MREGVQPTHLDPGEDVVVPHLEVRLAWNYAMEAYMRLEQFGHGQFVYGETWGWVIAEDYVKECRNRPAAKLGNCPQVGFTRTREKGSLPCNFCGKIESDMKQCSVCKRASYCSRDCQKKAWKAGHKNECVSF